MIKPIKYYVYNNLNTFRFGNTINRAFSKARMKGNIPILQMRELMNMEGNDATHIRIKMIIKQHIQTRVTKCK